jgi:uncharacterized protein (TIGR00255 family)
MIRSMTGFARRELVADWGQLAWELRAVNHRYLEIGLRLPEEFRAVEGQFRQSIGAAAKRGKIDGTLYFRPAARASSLEVNRELVGRVLEQARDVARDYQSERAPDIRLASALNPIDVLRWPGVIRDMTFDIEPILASSHRLLADALGEFNSTRTSEGVRLRDFLQQRCAALGQLVTAVERRLPEVRTRIRTRLNEKLAQLAVPANPERVEQELVLLAQKMDVDEEIERLRGHIEETVKNIGTPEPAGRRLDFLMQELNREANTLSSKSNDLETTRAAIDMKVLIEQMREQVQNIE